MATKNKVDEKSPPAKSDYGCSHYKRRCRLVCPCCKKNYPCRICHDEVELNHELDRFAVTNIICTECKEVQQVQEKCNKCGVVFGKYFCKVCNLFDDEDKQQFHCKGCGLCRVGGRENFYHCDICDMCLAISLKDHHKCIEKSSRSNCAVCLEDLHSSRIEAHIPNCGHLIHRTCYRQMIKTGNYGCPICGEAMVDMHTVWGQLDEEVANCPMPEEYKDYYVQILCKDCHKESNVIFHVIGLKCSHCGSYNTCRAANPTNNSSDTNQTTRPSQVSSSHEPNQMSSPHEPTQVSSLHEPSQVSSSHEPNQASSSHESSQVSSSHEPTQVSSLHEPNQVSSSHEPNQVSSSQEP